MDAPNEAIEALKASKEEDKRAHTLKFLTDLTCQRLAVERMSLQEAREAVAGLRKTALRLFPGKGDVFDLVLAPPAWSA